MKRRTRLLASTIAALFVAPALAGAQSYTLTRIEVPGATSANPPTGLSEDGWVVGNWTAAGVVGINAWMWKPDAPNGTTGAVTSFPRGSWLELRAEAVQSGRIATWGLTKDGNGNPYAFPMLWENGLFGPLYVQRDSKGTLIGFHGHPYAVNRGGEVAGEASNAVAYWSGAGTLVTTMPGIMPSTPPSVGQALAINTNGVMTGISTWGLDAHSYGQAFRSSRAGALQYMPLLPGTVQCTGKAINDLDEVAGHCLVSSSGGGSPQAFIHTGGVMTRITSFDPLFANVVATGINNRSVVVGTVNGPFGSLAMIWDAAHGARNLNTMVPAGSPTLLNGVKINDYGQIVAYSNNGRAYLLTPVNSAPVLTNPGNQTTAEGAGAILQLDASDADADTLTFSATGLPGDLVLNPASGAIAGTPSYTAAGAYNVTVTATDHRGASAGASFVWTITDTNRAPSTGDPGPQSSAEGDVVSLLLTATDPDGDSVAFSGTGLPPGVSISGTGLISGSLGYAAAGSYTASVTATDGRGGSTTVTFAWTVSNTNRGPSVINPGAQSTQQANAVALSIAASDPDGDSLTYSATGLPSGLSMSGSVIGGTVSSTAVSSAVTVTVSDGSVSASATFDWTITAPPPPPPPPPSGNRAPSCSAAQTTVTSIWPVNGKMVGVGISVGDVDGDAVSVSVTRILQDEANRSVDGSGIGRSSVMLRADRAGSGNGRFYEIGFTATDARGASCGGVLLVAVPHDQGKPPIDDGVRYDSTVAGGPRVR